MFRDTNIPINVYKIQKMSGSSAMWHAYCVGIVQFTIMQTQYARLVAEHQNVQVKICYLDR